MDDTTLRVYSVLFVIITIVLVYTARFFHSRRSRRVTEQQLIGFEHMPAWVGQAIDTSRPLHLSFGSAAVGSDGTPVALAEAEFFYQIIQATASSDSAPLISAASAATIPLAQDTVRRAWQGGDQLKRVRWYPSGDRSIAFAAAVSALMPVEEPPAHILAGSFGPELALILESAEQAGQGTLAVSDQLEGQAVAFAMADEVLIGEQMFDAAAYLGTDTSAHADARVKDIWRGLLIMGLAVLLLLNVTKQLQVANWWLILLAVLALILIGAILFRRR